MATPEGVYEFKGKDALWFIPNKRSVKCMTLDGAGVFKIPHNTSVLGIVYSILVTEERFKQNQMFAHDFKVPVRIYSEGSDYPVKLMCDEQLFDWFGADEVMDNEDLLGYEVTQYIA